jgi:hypothetical protein
VGFPLTDEPSSLCLRLHPCLIVLIIHIQEHGYSRREEAYTSDERILERTRRADEELFSLRIAGRMVLYYPEEAVAHVCRYTLGTAERPASAPAAVYPKIQR